MDQVKRSKKSRMKKRPEEWDQLKVELAQELGLWDKVRSQGWSGLSAQDSGRLGGVLAARRREIAIQSQQAAAIAQANIPGSAPALTESLSHSSP